MNNYALAQEQRQGAPAPSPTSRTSPTGALTAARVLWVPAHLGEGGLSWLAQWTHSVLMRDSRPALWIDTSNTLLARELAEFAHRLVIVQPDDIRESVNAAEIALQSGCFSLVALELHRRLHPLAITHAARLAQRRADSPLILWGETASFVVPPLGTPVTPLAEAVEAVRDGL